MLSDDSVTDEDSFVSLYSTQRVTSTYNTLLAKIKSISKTSDSNEYKNSTSNAKSSAQRDNEPNDRHDNDITCGTGNSSEFVELMDDCDIIHCEVERRTAPFAERPSCEEVIVLDDTLPSPSTVEESPILRRSTRRRTPRYPAVKSVPKTKSKKNKCKRQKSNSDEIIEVNVENELPDCVNTSLDDEMNYEVSVKVIWKSISVKTFRLRRFQKFSNIFQHFMEQENVPMDKILLSLRSSKINPNDTPESVDLKVYDFIDGGVLSDSTHLTSDLVTNSKCSNDADSICVKIQDNHKKINKFSINKDEPLKLIMLRYAEQVELPLQKLRFYFDGELIKSCDTPALLGLDNDEVIDVKIQ